MKKLHKSPVALTVALAMFFAFGGVRAQSNSQSSGSVLIMPQAVLFDAGLQAGAIALAAGAGTPSANTVVGAPYSAEITAVSVQSFGDGNSITHSSVSNVYRDMLGRTRREENITVLGQVQLGDAAHKIVMIFDPVAGILYNLNPTRKTGSSITLNGKSATLADPLSTPGGSTTIYFSVSSDDAGGGRGGTIKVLPSLTSPNDTVTESLGADTMQGVTVIGTRITRTIPAGKIGNAQDIHVITETWYSEDLQIYLKTIHSDPRTGTTTTTVTSLSRNVPDPSLFTVPPGYTINTVKPPEPHQQ